MSLYFNQKLGLDPDTSTALFHTYEFFVNFLTVLGAIVADTWLGLYKTLVSMSFVYAAGATIVSVASIDSLGLPMM